MKQLTIYKDYCAQKTDQRTIEDLVTTIRCGSELKEITERYRRTGLSKDKSKSPMFAVALTFRDGKTINDATGVTGLSMVDFDKIKDAPLDKLKRLLIQDPHTLLCYTTISNRGLRVIYRYEIPGEWASPEAEAWQQAAFRRYYSAAFFTGNRHFSRLISIGSDEACKNINRLSGLAYDPDAYFNPNAVAFSRAEVERTIDTEMAESYGDMMARRIQNYYEKTIVPKLAAENIAYAPGSHNQYVMRTGYMLAQKRYPKLKAIEWAVRKFPDYADTEQVFNSCFNSTTATNCKPNKRKSKTDIIKDFLSAQDIKLRHNVITRRTEWNDGQKWQNITDRVVNSLWTKLDSGGNQNITTLDICHVIDSDFTPTFNPFTQYLERALQSLAPGDQRDYIGELASTVRVKGGEEEQERWRMYLRKWLVGMVAAWVNENVVNNVMLVLIGEQGVYKTTWFNYLLPPELRGYFCTKTNSNRMTKDDLIALAQYGLICNEELDTMQPAELNQLKAAITTLNINERAAYAHYHEQRPHIASFCGTGNNIQFLSDTTGNRRWLPFEVTHIDSPYDRPLPYSSIFAQAYKLYCNHFVYWFELKDIAELNRHNKEFETPHLEYELVETYFRKPGDGENGEFVSASRALQIVSGNIAQKLSAINIARAFKELGFKAARNKNTRGFIAVVRTAEEVKSHSIMIALDNI